jgi:hypothetical protein
VVQTSWATWLHRLATFVLAVIVANQQVKPSPDPSPKPSPIVVAPPAPQKWIPVNERPLPATPAEDQQLVSLVAGVKDVLTQWVARARAWDLGPHFRAQLDAMDSAQQPVGSTGGSPEQVSWLALRLLCPLPPWPPALCCPDVRAAALYETSTAQRLALDALSQTNSVVSGTIAAVASGANRVRGMFTSLLGQQPAAQAGPGTPEAQELVATQPP